MTEKHINKIAGELKLSPKQVSSTAKLLEEGSTVPFIARYRKETTDSLDEVAITAIRDRLIQLEELKKRRESILGSLQERELLTDDLKEIARISEQTLTDRHAGVFVDDKRVDLPDNILILRPPSLVAGIGCNRNTGFDEIKGFLMDVLARFDLSPKSLKSLASIDLKSDEPGLLALAKDLDLPVRFFTKRELNSVETIQNPSTMVEKHIGVKSVCEAAAILGSNQGSLILPKQLTRNVTVAVARIPFAS